MERPSVKTCGRSKGPMLSCSFIVFLILCFSSNNPALHRYITLEVRLNKSKHYVILPTYIQREFEMYSKLGTY